ILAVSGIVAVAHQWMRSALRVLGSGAEAYFAGAVAETLADRGDLTGMAEASGAARKARRARAWAFLALVLWSVLLVLRSWILPRRAPVYSSYAALWFVAGIRRGVDAAKRSRS